MNLFAKRCFVLLLLLTAIKPGKATEWKGMPIIIHMSDAVSPGKTFTVNGFGFTDEPPLEIALERAGKKIRQPFPRQMRSGRRLFSATETVIF